jgi:hypothetical protein
MVDVLPQLLVTEAIRELQKRFEHVTDKSVHIESQILNFGRKPGFSMTAHICSNMPETIDGIEQVADFLAGKFSQTLFGVPATRSFGSTNRHLTIEFRTRPTWFTSLVQPGGSPGQQQQFWFRCYGHFMMGVYSGALLHFGFRAIPTFDPKQTGGLSFLFRLDELDGAWEFTGNLHS